MHTSNISIQNSTRALGLIEMWIIQMDMSAAAFFLSLSWIFDLVLVWIQFMLYLLPSRVFCHWFFAMQEEEAKKSWFDIWLELRISTDLTNRPSCVGDSFCLLVLINSAEGNAKRMRTEREERVTEQDREKKAFELSIWILFAKLTQQLSDQ